MSVKTKKTFLGLVNIIRELLRMDILHYDPESHNNMLVYRTAGEDGPEGWYSQNILSTVSELFQDKEQMEYMLSVAKDNGIDTDKFFEDANKLVYYGQERTTMNQKVYTIATCSSAWDIIPDAEHIERVTEIAEQQGFDETFDDFAAARLAKEDGVKLIDDIDGIYRNFYIDSIKNRRIIKDYMDAHPAQVGYELMGIRNTAMFSPNRPGKKEYYLEIARMVSKRSTCLKRHYGAVIVKDDEIIATGYNGAPRGEENCCDKGICPRMNVEHNSGNYADCPAVHAEQNAIISAPRRDLIGATLYLCGEEIDPETGNVRTITSANPCPICERIIKNAGISYVISYGTEVM